MADLASKVWWSVGFSGSGMGTMGYPPRSANARGRSHNESFERRDGSSGKLW